METGVYGEHGVNVPRRVVMATGHDLSCDNPAPANGGLHCPENKNDTAQCAKTKCPVPSVEDNSWTAIGIGVGIGLPAVVVGFLYILKRYRSRKPAESPIDDTTGDTGWVLKIFSERNKRIQINK